MISEKRRSMKTDNIRIVAEKMGVKQNARNIFINAPAEALTRLGRH